jgi:hypothetical protein
MLIDEQEFIIDAYRNSAAEQNLINGGHAGVERWANFDLRRPRQLDRSRKKVRHCTRELDRSTKRLQR